MVNRLTQWHEMPTEDEWPSTAQIKQVQERVLTTEMKANLREDERGLWVVIGEDGDGRVWLPNQDETKQLRSRLVVVAHAACAGHRGKRVTREAVKQWVRWPGMDEEISKFVEDCLQCARSESNALINRPWGEQVHATKPGEILHMDFLSIGTHGTGKYHYVLILKDDLSHAVDLIPTKDTKAARVVEACLHWFSRYGVPSMVVTDQGAHFRNVLVNEMEHQLGIKHVFSVPYCPWSNGTVERVNREVIRLLGILRSEMGLDTESWHDLLPLVQYVLNTSQYQSLDGLAPYQVITGLTPRTPLSFVLKREGRLREVQLDHVSVREIRSRFNDLKSSMERIH